MKVEITTETSDSHGIRVAVYGSLRAGMHNHCLLENSKFLGEHTVEEGFRMVSLGGFPAVLPAKDDLATPIKIEVYLVDDAGLSQLDSLEGHPDWYKREKVATPWKKAWMYVMPEDAGYEDHNPVDNGDWMDYYTQSA